MNDRDDVKFGMAALVACIVQTAVEKDPDFQSRFEKRLEEWYTTLTKTPGRFDIQALETLAWARSAVRAERPTCVIGS